MSGHRDVAADRPAFVLDLNRCTGCHACQLACSIENELGFDRSWREIVTFNERRHPAVPLHHLSLACHHCAEAPCMRGCPARAYTRDAGTGAVLLDADRCIGCRYCLWVCPYDAPRFDAVAGVVSKCTFCSHRLAAGQEPACTTACPTGALGFGTLAVTVTDVETPVAGLPRIGIGPALRVHPLRPGAAVEEMATSMSTPAPPPVALPPLDLAANGRTASGDISVRSEWTLIVFTLLVAVLVALFGATLAGERTVDPFAFLGVALVGMGLSTLHLGRKRRAWRAVLHPGTSWLSREVAGFGLFLALAALHLLVPAVERVCGWSAIAAGIFTLVAMDQVYRSIPAADRRIWHSADVLLTAAYLLGFLARNPWVFATAGLIKLVLYLGRRRVREGERRRSGERTAAGTLHWMLLRVGMGLLAPAVLWLWSPAAGSPAWMSPALAALLIGEFIDRCEFYAELESPGPRRQIAIDLAARLRDAG